MTYDIITKVLNDHAWEGMPLIVPTASELLGFRETAIDMRPEDSFDWLTDIVCACVPAAVDRDTCIRLLLATGQFKSPLAAKCLDMIGMGEVVKEDDELPTE